MGYIQGRSDEEEEARGDRCREGDSWGWPYGRGRNERVGEIGRWRLAHEELSGGYSTLESHEL